MHDKGCNKGNKHQYEKGCVRVIEWVSEMVSEGVSEGAEERVGDICDKQVL